MKPPTIRILEASAERVRARIEGGTIAPEWTVRPGHAAWCEFTVYPDGNVGSFGGEVWPLAWPLLFASTGTVEWPRGTAQTPAGVRLTTIGVAALAVALRVNGHDDHLFSACPGLEKDCRCAPCRVHPSGRCWHESCGEATHSAEVVS